MQYGIIYIAHNARDGDSVFKVGKTERSIDERMKELTSSSSNLGTYSAVAYFVVTDIELAEKACHKRLSRYRVQDNREFFDIPLPRLLKIVKEEVSHFTVSNSIPELPQDPTLISKKSVNARDLLKAARQDKHARDKSWDQAYKESISTFRQWCEIIKKKALEARKELHDEDIIKWEIPESIDIDNYVRSASWIQMNRLCSVLILSKFANKPLVLNRSGVRGGSCGTLDLSHAISSKVTSTHEDLEFISWKESDDGRIGSITLWGHIDNNSMDDRKDGNMPSPLLHLEAKRIYYDDYHHDFKDYSQRKTFNDPEEALEVFLSILADNIARPQYDVRTQNGFRKSRHVESYPRINDSGDFKMTLLEDDT